MPTDASVTKDDGVDAKEDGPVELPKGKVIAKRWRVQRKLGEGGCGSVYKVKDLRDGSKKALKAESNNVPSGSVLKLEVQVLTKLAGRRQVIELYQSGKRPLYQYFVMTLLGPSLADLTANIQKCSVATQVRVGIQVLYCIKQLHEVGFIHRDMKPSNMAFGLAKNAQQLYILDFGLAREFVIRNNGKASIRRARKHVLFRGTSRYCSLNVHRRSEQGRPDDLWSMIYLLAEMRGALPWGRFTDRKEIESVKRETSDAVLLRDCPVQMLDITAHLRSIDYYTRPNYALIFKRFNDVMEKAEIKQVRTAMERSMELSVDQTLASDEAQDRKVRADRMPYTLEDFEKNDLGF
ncbi:Protein kinase domain containing protein [Aphelenchoides avenae]|nr:Protein kinase domain containing protein [Aphelenchus avenae]